MGDNVIIYSEREGICEIVLNRPDRYNALSNELMNALLKCLNDFEQSATARVCIFKGAGKNFSSGADIKQFQDAAAQTPEEIHLRAQTSMEIHQSFSRIKKPIICSVRGYALAGGCGLAMAGDYVVASENAVFGYPEVRRGIVPALVMANLTKLVGRRKALEYVLTGRRISAFEALQVGMINMVVADDKLEERTLEIASDLLRLNKESVATIKNLFYQVSEMSLLDGLQTGRKGNIEMRMTDEFSKGVAKFNSKTN